MPLGFNRERSHSLIYFMLRLTICLMHFCFAAKAAFGVGMEALTKENIEAAYDLRSCEPNIVVTRNADELSIDRFLLDFLLPNRPVVVRGVTDSWGASQDWVKDGIPNVEHLKEQFSTAEVCVEDPKDQSRKTMPAEDYFKNWDSGAYYLKDWHFARDFPEAADFAYQTPDIFTLDWLNLYCVEVSTQYSYAH